jgi:hypothetical protein
VGACAAALGALLWVAVVGQGGPRGRSALDDLAQLGPHELATLYDRADLGRPFVGVADGRLVYLADRQLPRFKLRVSKAVWRGKAADEDGHFANRWIGGRQAIDSHYVIGPSWVDGRPAIIMEYPPGTALFANMHDEVREIAPGLYLGPVFERFPCPKFRGFVALQMEHCGHCGP